MAEPSLLLLIPAYNEEARIEPVLREFGQSVTLTRHASAYDPATSMSMSTAKRLALREAKVFITSFDRPNISYTIVQRDKPREQLLDFLKKHRDASGIVYCLSRKKVDETDGALTGAASFVDRRAQGPSVPHGPG